MISEKVHFGKFGDTSTIHIYGERSDARSMTGREGFFHKSVLNTHIMEICSRLDKTGTFFNERGGIP
jgi:hypothetical protein